LLLRRRQQTAFEARLCRIEMVDDDADKQIHYEKVGDDNKKNEI